MKKIIKSLVGILFTFTVIGCSWQIPKTVTVKQKAEYVIPLGGINQSLDEYFSIKDILAGIDSGENESQIKAYDYNPDGKSDVQQLLLQMNVQDISFDFADYFDESSLSTSLDLLSFSQDFDVPDVKFDFENDIKINFLEPIVNQLISFMSTTTGGEISFVANQTGMGTFGSVTYDSGILNIIAPACADGDEVIIKHDGTEVLRGRIRGGAAELQLGGKTIYSTGMTLEVVTALPVPAPISAVPEDTNKIKKASGITVTVPRTPDPLIKQEIDAIDGMDKLKKLIIGKGNLKTKLVLPESWTGVSLGYDFTMEGGLNLASPFEMSNTKSISLDDTEIKAAKTNVTGNIELSLDNATIDFSDNLKIQVATEINKISLVSFEIDDFTSDVDVEEDLPEELLRYLKEINFEKAGLKIHYENDLPPGNSIGFDVKSNFLSINKTESITTGLNDLTLESTDVKIEFTPELKMDLKAKIKLPGSTVENPKLASITNIEPGKTYKLSMKITPVLEWSYVKINSKQITSKDVITTGVNLNSFMAPLNDVLATSGIDSILDQIKLPKAPFYLYIDLPDVLSNLAIKGKINLFYGKVDDAGTINKIDAVEEVALLEESQNIASVSYPKLTIDEKGVVTSDLSKVPNSISTDKISNILTEALAIEDGELMVDYDIYVEDKNGSVDEVITINKEMLNDKSASIAIKAAVVLPFSFSFDGAMSMDIMSMLGGNITPDSNGNKDFFGRSPDAYQELTKEMKMGLDSIESINLTYKSTALPFNVEKDAMTLRMNLYGDNLEKHFVDYKFKGGNISVSPEIIQNLLEKPFYPSIELILGKEGATTGFSIPRDMKIGMKFDFALKTDANISVDLSDALGSVSSSGKGE